MSSLAKPSLTASSTPRSAYPNFLANTHLIPRCRVKSPQAVTRDADPCRCGPYKVDFWDFGVFSKTTQSLTSSLFLTLQLCIYGHDCSNPGIAPCRPSQIANHRCDAFIWVFCEQAFESAIALCSWFDIGCVLRGGTTSNIVTYIARDMQLGSLPSRGLSQAN
ncbi:uncharacterized protein LOC133716596 [Rosa rugosa]|uniref:uncharacterized protein LOC133716596 n=1 Tax=Rosa rugosa TaxID=74645 RepID=UPI002B4131B0|nr:uncharacterized protein LOC133716596 [Rosa rugosa]